MKYASSILPSMTLAEIREAREQYANDCELLQPKCEELARMVCDRINAEVPLEQGAVKYARQHVLETVAALLQGRV